MYRSRARLRLGMPHTQSGGLSEVALLAYLGDLRWRDVATAIGVPAASLRDAEGHAVYASFYFVEVDGLPAQGLGAFGPDDDLDIVSGLVRFGRSMLDGDHCLYRAGTLGAELPATLPSAPRVRLSNVFVREGTGPDDLRVTAPATGRIEDVPVSPAEPDSYRLAKEARERGSFFAAPAGATPLWPAPRVVEYRIDPDRDVNGVGLVYFANYVAFMDHAERRALEESGAYAPDRLDGRRTLRRRIGFYGNARRHDMLAVEVETLALTEPDRLLVHHRVCRRADGRLIAVSSVEKALCA
ncbi:MAG TPA: LnmK family bifunctional acyltransferase/decarboxylase [Candidatus Nitrosopolaris sp.]|nr:LnmK family bifunctional acyltransferase/decarboxylase [Candidatus Nitrosopolaris sp.]